MECLASQVRGARKDYSIGAHRAVKTAATRAQSRPTATGRSLRKRTTTTPVALRRLVNANVVRTDFEAPANPSGEKTKPLSRTGRGAGVRASYSPWFSLGVSVGGGSSPAGCSGAGS